MSYLKIKCHNIGMILIIIESRWWVCGDSLCTLYFSECFYIFIMKVKKIALLNLKNMHREKTEKNYNKNSVSSYVRIMRMMG